MEFAHPGRRRFLKAGLATAAGAGSHLFPVPTEHAGDIAPDAFVRSDGFPEFPDTPYLDVSVTTDEGNRKLVVAIVNRHPTSDVPVEIIVEGFAMPSSVDLFEVNGPSLDSTNTFAPPNNVGINIVRFLA